MQNIFFDGLHMKGLNIPMSWDSDIGWDVYGKDMEDKDLYSRVAVVFRAVDLNANALSNVPFALVTERGADYDTSADWQNKVGFMPNPRKLFRLWRKSLTMTNAFYGWLERGKPLRYLVPNTIKPDADKDGLKGFWRQVGTSRIYYPESNKSPIIHGFRMDFDTELLPSENTEFKALMSAAGILFHSDYFVGEFFQRGGIKPHMLLVKGVPNKEERERIESTWDKLMRGLRKYIGKVYNAEAMEAKPLGAGVDDFKDNQFYQQALKNIAFATGIPETLLLANSANYATAKSDMKNWYDNSVIPWANFMADELTDNLFSKMGLRFEFRGQQTDPDQEEELRRANGFVAYSSMLQKANNPKANSIAAKIVGVDLPPDVTYEMLDERDESLEPEPAAPFGQQQDDEDADMQEAEAEMQEAEKTVTWYPNADHLKELNNWMDISIRKVGRGEGVPSWDTEYLPADVAGMIYDRLSKAVDVAGVKAAFDLSNMQVTRTPEYKTDIMILADAINKLAETGVKENG